MKPVSWDEITEEILNENFKRRMIWGENIMAVRVELAASSSVETHQHVSEQLTMVLSGSVVVLFDDGAECALKAGDMLLIPASKPHAVTVGPEPGVLIDFFSPIREDFVQGRVSQVSEEGADPYRRLHGILRSKGIKTPIEQLRELPLELLARYVYEKECVTMGQLREILGMDKTQARNLLRQWKHGDDHSESSLKRKLERLIDLSNIAPYIPAKTDRD